MKPFNIFIAILVVFAPLQLQAQEGGAIDYTQAYQKCSPVADQLAKQQCNYSRLFEAYYLQCMKEKGYNDENNLSQEYYDGYMQAYQYCSSISDRNAKEYCSYGQLYKNNYDQCMIKYGFNQYGERVNSEGKKGFEFNF